MTETATFGGGTGVGRWTQHYKMAGDLIYWLDENGSERTYSTDSAGRITLPQTLRNFADIGTNSNSVVIAGAPNRLEIWNEARWLSNLTEVQSRPPAPELLRELVG